MQMHSKRIPITIIILYGLLLGFQSSCHQEKVEPEGQSASSWVAVRYGTSFGFCLGYCNRDLVVTSGQLEFSKSGRPDTVQTVTCIESIEPAEWANLTSAINLEDFFELDEVIGCPDCADGGAEYLELDLINRSHRVQFEYGREPAAMTSYIGLLRDWVMEMEECVD